MNGAGKGKQYENKKVHCRGGLKHNDAWDRCIGASGVCQ